MKQMTKDVILMFVSAFATVGFTLTGVTYINTGDKRYILWTVILAVVALASAFMCRNEYENRR